MTAKLFGKIDTGTDVFEYILKNEYAEVSIITYGAAIRKFVVYGTDIVGGFDTLSDYLLDDSHQGAVIGRVANRIADASFVMDGVRYYLPKNDGENCLHGGVGFDRRCWVVDKYDGTSITLSYTSPDGEEGFPGELSVSVTYTLTGTALMISYDAIPYSKTPIALTNHAYFNLDGLGGTILSHVAEIFADRYTEVGDDLIPNGNRPSVVGTAFDFREPHAIGERVGGDFLGYDHNYLLTPDTFGQFGDKSLGLAARVSGERLSMSVYTDQPGIQFYIGNFLGGGIPFKGGAQRKKHGAFCLETQTEPNCINRGEGFYEGRKRYTHTTVYEISLKK